MFLASFALKLRGVVVNFYSAVTLSILTPYLFPDSLSLLVQSNNGMLSRPKVVHRKE
jgi:hypothetical protein